MLAEGESLRSILTKKICCSQKQMTSTMMLRSNSIIIFSNISGAQNYSDKQSVILVEFATRPTCMLTKVRSITCRQFSFDLSVAFVIEVSKDCFEAVLGWI